MVGMLLCLGAWAEEPQTLQEKINSAEAGATVTLDADITLTERIDVNKSLTIDLGGHTITTTATCGNGSAFNVQGGTVTIQNGTIDASFGEANSGETDAITARSGSDVTLKVLNITVNTKNGACVYAFEGGKITIESGHYENQTTEKYEWNASITAMVVNQANIATQLVFINGGTFKGHDPSLGDDSQTANENATFLAPGIALEKDESGNFVTAPAVASIGRQRYSSLAAAIAAVKADETIKLVADINTNETVTNANENNFTIDLNGKKWVSSSDAFKNNGGTVTLTGDGLVKSTAADGIAVWARTGSIVINGGNYENCSNEEATVYVGTTDENLDGKQPTITINGGTFRNTAEGVYKWNTKLLPLTLNIINNIANADTYQAIVINGGKFIGNDPCVGDDSQLNKVNKNSNFIAPDLHAAKNAGGEFEIVPGSYVAQVGYLKYVTMAEALEAGNEITLLADVTVETIDVVKDKTVIKNGHQLSVNTFEVIDFGTFDIPFDFTAKTARYTRSVASNEWGTICVPFTLKSCDAYILYKVSGIEGSNLNITRVEEAAPGEPVIFQNVDKVSSLTFETENAAVSNVAPASSELVGTYSQTKITEGLSDIYFINGDHFHQAQVSLTVPAYRAYIKFAAQGAKPATLSLRIAKETLGLESVNIEKESAPAIYDVNGIRLPAPKKGLNIVKLANGKTVKMIVK